MPNLILGPLLRYVGTDDATIWVETDEACDVAVLGCHAQTFAVFSHHYAMVHVSNLKPGSVTEYEVTLDGQRVWPLEDSSFPPSVIRTLTPEAPFKLTFGSCRVSVPHEPPYTLRKEQDERGREVDALYALAVRMTKAQHESWPDALLLLGDQVYADEVSQGALDFIHSRRDPSEPPGEQVADFEEYTRLYWDSWSDPLIRWLLSTVPSVMIFDDHDVLDDWNISESWVSEMRALPWWDERIIGAFMSYWIYQHLGNLSPRELEADEMYQSVKDSGDAGQLLRDFAWHADRDADSYRWSVFRDFGKTRLVVMDSRAGRVLKGGHRSMVDAVEWAWIEERVSGDYDHILLATSLPFVLGPGIHYLEAWNEAVCAGAWGKWATRLGERIRRAIDLEHWSAFQYSFGKLTDLLRSITEGERGRPPASIALLSGDVHHAYLAEITFNQNAGIDTHIYQAVCSPLRNSLAKHERRFMRFGWTRTGQLIGRMLGRSVNIKDSGMRWQLAHEKPWFNNQIATLELQDRKAFYRLEKTDPDRKEAWLEEVFSHTLS